MGRLQEVGKTVLDQKLREALNSNKLYQNAMKAQDKVRDLINNPTQYVDNASKMATNRLNQEIDRATGRINDKINERYNKVIGSRVDEANARIRKKMEEINNKLAKSGATTRLTEDDIRTLLIQTPNVNADIKELYKGQF